jgi:hypothetical protein
MRKRAEFGRVVIERLGKSAVTRGIAQVWRWRRNRPFVWLTGAVFLSNDGLPTSAPRAGSIRTPSSCPASDYCYSDRLHNRSYDLVLQPMAFRFCFLWQNRRAVLLSLSFGRIFRDGVSFRLRSQFPEEPSPVSVDWWPKPFVSLKPCDLVVERTFPDF